MIHVYMPIFQGESEFKGCNSPLKCLLQATNPTIILYVYTYQQIGIGCYRIFVTKKGFREKNGSPIMIQNQLSLNYQILRICKPQKQEFLTYLDYKCLYHSVNFV